MRTINSLKNMIAGLFGQILMILLTFITRTVFIRTLSEAYLGINGLLVSVISVLSLAELGLGSAINYALYKPLAEQDITKVKQLLIFFRKAYRIIGCVFFAAGLAVMPFLSVFTRGTTDLVDLRLVFLLFLLETATSYWFFAFYSTVLFSDQKSYVSSVIGYFASLFSAVARIIILVAFRSRPQLAFYCYSAVGVFTNIFLNLLVRRKVRIMYPWARDLEAPPLSREEKSPIYKNVVGMSANKICRILNDGIDSTIISGFIGLAANGIFSNYIALRSYVSKLLSIAVGSITASLGNYCAKESIEQQEHFFRSLQFIYFWLYGFCAICFYMLFNSFIVGVWLHDTKWLLPERDVFLLVFNFLIEGIASAVVKYRDVNGLFWETKYRYIISSVLNATLSIVLVGPMHMGVTGALLGTTVSLAVMISYDPVTVYRKVFHKGAWEFYRMYFGFLLLVIATGALVFLICLPFRAYTFANFLIRMAICLILPNGIWYLLFRKDERFLYLKKTLSIVIDYIQKTIRRRNAAQE